MARIQLRSIIDRQNPPLPDQARLRRELNLVIGTSLRVMETDYRATFKTWRHKPKVVKEKISPGDFIVRVEGDVWHFLNEGTRDHFVRPVRARALRFFRGGGPKTSPGIIRAGAGAPATEGPFFSKGHRVRGIRPRRFDEVIARKNEDLTDRLVTLTLQRLGL